MHFLSENFVFKFFQSSVERVYIEKRVKSLHEVRSKRYISHSKRDWVPYDTKENYFDFSEMDYIRAKLAHTIVNIAGCARSLLRHNTISNII